MVLYLRDQHHHRPVEIKWQGRKEYILSWGTITRRGNLSNGKVADS